MGDKWWGNTITNDQITITKIKTRIETVQGLPSGLAAEGSRLGKGRETEMVNGKGKHIELRGMECKG